MHYTNINPFVRYARYLNLNASSHFDEVVALDSRLFFAINGHGKIKIDSVEYDMSGNSLLIINHGVPYKIFTPETTVNYIQINFDFTQQSSDHTQPVVPLNKTEFTNKMILEDNDFPDVIYVQKIDILQNRLNDIVNEYTQKLLYYDQKIGHILADCISDTMRFKELGNISVKDTDHSDILLYLHTHYNENLTNKSVADFLGYHPNYVSYLIKQLTGLPLHSYIIRIRLEKAADLLVNSDLSVSEIATECGFYDSAYFSGYFKKRFGTSPSKYRNI